MLAMRRGLSSEPTPNMDEVLREATAAQVQHDLSVEPEDEAIEMFKKLMKAVARWLQYAISSSIRSGTSLVLVVLVRGCRLLLHGHTSVGGGLQDAGVV